MFNWAKVENEINCDREKTALTKHVLASIKVKKQVEHESEIFLTLSVPNIFIKESFERDMAISFQTYVGKNQSKNLVFEYVVESSQFSFPIFEDVQSADEVNKDTSIERALVNSESKFQFKSKYSFNSRMTFDHLAITRENEFSVRALKHFSESTSDFSNCAALFGSSGVGKTHLLNAIGWQLLGQKPNIKIKIVSGDEFINDFQTAIFTKTMGEFRNKYRLKTDVLLIDDLQIIEKAKGTQGELFNLLNEFSLFGKKIIITSDKQMSELSFDDRLKSRFSAGLVLNLDLPSLESKKLFLEQRLLELNLALDPEMFAAVFSSLGSCYRSIEGAVSRLQMLKKIDGCVQQDAVFKMFPKVDKKLALDFSIESVISNIAMKHKLKKQDLVGPSRKREIFEARKEAIKNIRENFNLSLKEIGRIFNRDHTSIINALKN